MGDVGDGDPERPRPRPPVVREVDEAATFPFDRERVPEQPLRHALVELDADLARVALDAGDRHSSRLLGVQLGGHLGSEIAKRIDIPATAILNEMTVDQISDLDLSCAVGQPLGSSREARGIPTFAEVLAPTCRGDSLVWSPGSVLDWGVTADQPVLGVYLFAPPRLLASTWRCTDGDGLPRGDAPAPRLRQGQRQTWLPPFRGGARCTACELDARSGAALSSARDRGPVDARLGERVTCGAQRGGASTRWSS